MFDDGINDGVYISVSCAISELNGGKPEIEISTKSKIPYSRIQNQNQKARPVNLIIWELFLISFSILLSLFPKMAASSSLCFLTPPTSSPSSSTIRSPPSALFPTRFHRTNLKASSSRRLPYDAVVVTPDARAWVGSRYDQGENDELDYESEDEEEKEEDRSLDLLVRFLYNVFRNVSRRVRRAVRSVLPPSIPSKLVVSIVSFLKIEVPCND